MKKTILYVWGYNSSPDCESVNNLKTLMPDYNVISDYYAQYNPEEAINDIETIIKDNNVDLVVGSSLGAYLTLQLKTKLPRIIINTCLHPEIELENLTEEMQLSNEKGEPVYNEDGTPKTEIVPSVPQHIVDYYKSYIKNHDVWENKTDSIWAINGNDDELLGTKYVSEITEQLGKYVILSKQGHRNTKESLETYVVPTIKSILENE